ncbi:MAG: hypothetical protein HY716_17590 [Planctomycetes bacterium]|nr:hypothetical protein [Planctomycetota bacterium]
MDDTAPIDRAARIIDSEAAHIRARVAESGRRLQSPAAALTAATEILNLRSRYFGVTGEHFGIQDFDGIRVIDALDERLLKGLHEILKKFVAAHRRSPDLRLLAMLTEKISPGFTDMPQYPVAYMVLYLLRTAFDRFQNLADAGAHDLAELEHAFVHHLLGLVDKFVQTRERPVWRHFSDVAREYSVVSRLKCSCGDEKFDVKRQSLCQRKGAPPYDRLDLSCKACGAEKTILFDLPHFQDMYRI